MEKAAWKIVKVMAGTFLMALAVNLIYEPMNMVTGGVSGLAIVVKEMTKGVIKGGIPVWLTNLIINIPIFLWGYFVKGKKFLCYTFFANICFSFFMLLLPIASISQKDYFLSALIGGVLTGIGLGLVFSTGNSTGGTDLLSSIIHKYLNMYSVATILFVLDAFVILTGVVIFGVSSAVYAVLAVFLSSKIMDQILSGLKVGKQVWIISEDYQKISDVIIQEMDRGVTCLDGKGMYTEKTKKVLFCVVGKREVISVVNIVRQIDSTAFVVIQDVREVMGEGFGEIGY